MSDITGTTNLTSSSAGDTSLTGIKATATNLNADKTESAVSTSVDSEIALFSSTTGKIFKRAAGSGFVKALLGVISYVASIVEGDLGLTDITTANVTSSLHGFVPKSPADATKFLNGAATPAFAQVTDANLSVSDVTTNNVSTTAHGFAPKAPNDATKFLNGANPPAWTTPAVFAFKNGVTTRDVSTASGVQNIAHGLGVTPKYIRITCILYTSTGNILSRSDGVYNGTTNSGLLTAGTTGTNGTSQAVDIGSAIALATIANADTTNNATAVATFDGTNIILTWTKNGTPTGTAKLMWEAIG